MLIFASEKWQQKRAAYLAELALRILFLRKDLDTFSAQVSNRQTGSIYNPFNDYKSAMLFVKEIKEYLSERFFGK